MHLLDEEELAHVGKILKKGYVRVHKPKKRPRVKDILFCIIFSLLALLFLALSLYCICWVVNGNYLFVALPGLILCAAVVGISIREIHLSLDHYMPTLGSKRSHAKSPPNFLPDPDEQVNSPSHQSSITSSLHQSSHDFSSEETTSIFKSVSVGEVVKYSTFEESIQFGKDPEMIRSVSQYAVEDSASDQDQLIAKTADQSSFSSSRKRFCHSFESDEGSTEIKTLPFIESSIPVATKEIDKNLEKGSSQSLPAIKFISNSDA